MCILTVRPLCVSLTCVLNVYPPTYVLNACVPNVCSQCVSSMRLLNVFTQCVYSMCLLNVCSQCVSSMRLLNVFTQCVYSMCLLNVCPKCVFQCASSICVLVMFSASTKVLTNFPPNSGTIFSSFNSISEVTWQYPAH